MKIYTNTKFIGHYPAGTAAVVIAKSKQHAAEMLEKRLMTEGLDQEVSPDDFEQIPKTQEQVIIMHDGDYWS